MINIRLYCVSGMLSTLLINKIKDAAKLKEIDIDIDAILENNLDKSLKGVDVVLLGPQVAYKLPKFSRVCIKHDIACDVINMKDYGMMNGEKILETAIRIIDENKKRIENEKLEVERKARLEEIDRLESEKLAKQRELERQEAERIAKQKEEAERLEREKELEKKRMLEEENEKETILMTSATVEEYVNNENKIYVDGKENGIKGYNEMIKEAKKMLLSAEQEVYISTNIKITELQEELLEVSQRGVKITVVSFNKYDGEELPIDKLYTYIDEKDKTVNTKIMMTVDGRKAFVAEKDFNNNEIINTETEDKLLTSVVARNINNYIYLLKLRDNINFKLRDN